MPLPDDEQSNKEFVTVLKEFSVLYDYNLKEYSNRNEQEKAWREIASRFNATDSECKLRYKNIRNSLLRYLRNNNKTGSASKKPYYLWDQLQFLLPYTKSKVQSDNLGIISITNPLDEPADGSENEDDPREEIQSSSLPTNVRPVSNLESGMSAASAVIPATTHTSTPAWRSSKMKTKKDDPLKKAIASYYEKKQTEPKDEGTEADLHFFKSLLPDIKHFSPAKKRIFKRKVLEIIDDLSED